MLELAFVMTQRQNLFFVEIVEALRHELTQMGIQSTVSTNGFPAPAPERVYVIVPPHEYVALGGRLPAEPLLNRTIFICAEQPGSSHFAENIDLAPRAGAVFDISRWSIREFARQGISVEHFQLGYSPLWDHFERDREATSTCSSWAATATVAPTISPATRTPCGAGAHTSRSATTRRRTGLRRLGSWPATTSGICSGGHASSSTSIRAPRLTSSGIASFRESPTGA